MKPKRQEIEKDGGKEQHQFLGFMDAIKALLMRFETPETRVLEKRSLRVDEA
jgi:hypothetical protein